MDDFLVGVKKHLTWACQSHGAKAPSFDVEGDKLIVGVFNSTPELGHIDVPMMKREFSLDELRTEAGLDRAYSWVASAAIEATRLWF